MTRPGKGVAKRLCLEEHIMPSRNSLENRDINNALGPEGPGWPRLDYQSPNRCGLVYLPQEVRDQFIDETSEKTPDGRRWPRPTQILMEPGMHVSRLSTFPTLVRETSMALSRVRTSFFGYDRRVVNPTRWSMVFRITLIEDRWVSGSSTKRVMTHGSVQVCHVHVA